MMVALSFGRILFPLTVLVRFNNPINVLLACSIQVHCRKIALS